MKKRNYQEEMEKAESFTQLLYIGEAMLLDPELAQPRHQMATLASIYRDEHARIVRDTIPY